LQADGEHIYRGDEKYRRNPLDYTQRKTVFSFICKDIYFTKSIFCIAANAGSLKTVAQSPLSERLFLPIIPQIIK